MSSEPAASVGQPLTRGWKFTILFALIVALANSGVETLRSREDQRYQNHEQRIDALERENQALRAALDVAKIPVPPPKQP